MKKSLLAASLASSIALVIPAMAQLQGTEDYTTNVDANATVDANADSTASPGVMGTQDTGTTDTNGTGATNGTDTGADTDTEADTGQGTVPGDLPATGGGWGAASL